MAVASRIIVPMIANAAMPDRTNRPIIPGVGPYETNRSGRGPADGGAAKLQVVNPSTKARVNHTITNRLWRRTGNDGIVSPPKIPV